MVEFVEKRFASILIFNFLLASSAQASLLSDSFIGLSRGALQDATPTWDNSDPYQVMGNPAWFAKRSEVSALYSVAASSLGSDAQKEDPSQLLVFSLVKLYGDFAIGAIAFLPTSAQPILDTGNAEESSSPWMNMTRQLLYAGHFAYRPQGAPWSLGVMLPLYFDATVTASSQLETSDVNSRASVVLTPRLSYGIGFSYEEDPSEGWGAGLYYKERSRSRAQASIEGNIPVLSLDLLFEGESFYSFDPRRLSANVYHRSLGNVWGLRARFSNWVEYRTPFIRVTDSSLVLSDRDPIGKSKNTWDIALSWDHALNEISSLSSSLGYRPTPFEEVPSFYDADHYIVGLGYRVTFASDWNLATSLRVHILDTGHVYTWGSLGVGYRL